IASAGGLAPPYFALPDQVRGELGGATMLAPRAAQDECVTAVLDECLRIPGAVSGRDLCHRLEAQNTTATDLAQPRQRVLESVDRAEGIELVDHEPQALVDALGSAQRLEDGEPNPAGDDGTQRGDLVGAVRDEQRSAAADDPVADREACAALSLH